MVSDFTNVNNQLIAPADLFKQSQQGFVGKNPSNKSDLDEQKFPSNDKIEELVASALELQKKGHPLDRGCIVNILA